MDAETITHILTSLNPPSLTKTSHKEIYPAISPTRPALSQAGRTIVITGGGTGVGFSIAKSFVRASASTVIILGRRTSILAEAAAKLEEEGRIVGTNTKIIAKTCDVVDLNAVKEFWDGLKKEGIVVDVYVANAAKFTEPKPMLELGAEEVWSQVEVNAKSPLFFVEKFYEQEEGGQKFLVNVTSAVIHMTAEPLVAERPAYVLSKMTGTLMVQLIALNIPAEKMQIVSFHPGMVYGDGWKAAGIPPEVFDNDELCGAYAVWAASKEAAFLHGRYTWASWDMEELASGDLRKRIDEDPEFLRASIVGANGGK